jgi:coenzyme F420 hydrogenase subunit beta
MKKIRNAYDVARWRLCVGCGVCSYVCLNRNIVLSDVVHDGIRPFLKKNDCSSCDICLRVCPGLETSHNGWNELQKVDGKLKRGWGPVLELWEGYAVDTNIRFNGSSGGLVSALALYCLEREGMGGVLHIEKDEFLPWKNKTGISRNRFDILAKTGSRYSPASPCDSLDYMERADGPVAFIGKPCDIAGLRKAEALRPEIRKKEGITIGIFCAGTPSTQGTLDLLKKLGVDPDRAEEIRYRGRGWPGNTFVRFKGSKLTRDIPYEESWGFLNNYRPFRCYLCPDGTSEFADISCGDPWYRTMEPNEIGHSLLLVRTESGRTIVRRAMEAGYIKIHPVSAEALMASQTNLFQKRSAIWGRLLAMRLFGIPTPRLDGFHLFENWMVLPLKEKGRSIVGTMKRIIKRKYYKPKSLTLE